MNGEIAVFGGGCFWCTEAIFKMLKGIKDIRQGYAGGNPLADGKNPTYNTVWTGKTGHAEVIRIEFDPKIISFRELLSVFFSSHDPTSLNRQGPDVGTEYRSTILFTNDSQKKESEKYIKELNQSSLKGQRIVTEIKPLEEFYEAESYHQDFYNKNREAMYTCKVCGQRLFSSDAKFDSGTGWPSFDEAIPGSVKESVDESSGIHRIEISCAVCGSHLGHVFSDGPTKTGKRYCLNSICLDLEENK